MPAWLIAPALRSFLTSSCKVSMSSYFRIGVTSSHFSASHPAMLTSFWNFHSLPCASQADQVLYPFRLAVYSYLPVPKWSVASPAARSLVMWFISISTPMVCFFRFSICLSVLAFIMFSSVVSGFVSAVASVGASASQRLPLATRTPFVVPILTLNGGDSKRLNVQKMRAKDCVEYTLAILAIVW